MSVSDMRKYLSELRTYLDIQSEDKPFMSSLQLTNGQSVFEFARLVALGIHEKRSKVKKAAQLKEPPE
jgi:hypothetical protein